LERHYTVQYKNTEHTKKAKHIQQENKHTTNKFKKQLNKHNKEQQV